MARELALPSPPFDLGRALGQGIFTMWILEILRGGEIVLGWDVEEHAPPGRL